MPSIFIMPASTAALAAAGGPPRFCEYEHADAVLFAWRVDKDSHRGQNLETWKNFLESWGYTVTVVYCDGPETLAPTREETHGDTEGSTCGATKKFKSLLHDGIVPDGDMTVSVEVLYQMDEEELSAHWMRLSERETPARKKLLIVGYFGHGTVRDNGTGRKWLYGASNGRYLPISYLEEYARDHVGATDTLFVLETCFGGFDGMPGYDMGRYLSETLCEVIAGSDGDDTIGSDMRWDNLSSRLVGTLRRNERYGLTAKELYELVQDETIARAPGYYESHGLFDSILLAPTRDSPVGRKMAGQPDLHDRDRVPGAVQPKSITTIEEDQFLESWSDDQKRKVMQLRRKGMDFKELTHEVNLMFQNAVRDQGDSASNQGEYVHRGLYDYERLVKLLMRKDRPMPRELRGLC